MVESVCCMHKILRNCGYVLRAVFPTEVLGTGIYSSVVFGGSMVLANAVGGLGYYFVLKQEDRLGQALGLVALVLCVISVFVSGLTGAPQ
jgi:hypothetical protein